MGLTASKVPDVEIADGVFITTPKKKQRRSHSILSFDGGGSRGVMECVLLDVIFRLASAIVKKPAEMPDIKAILSAESENETTLKQLLRRVDPYHPTAAFDMIVGTSTGGLIAMGLLAGKVVEGRRVSMTVDELILMYLRKTEVIFGRSAWTWYSPARWWFNLFRSLPYSQGNLEKVLKEIFGDACMKDVESSCVGGCVAKVVGVKEERLKFFNNVSIFDKDVPIYQALLATCDAPIYFDGPVEINGEQFVDGGVGGNCPLAQAIPTALEMWGKDTNLLVVSLAPPTGSVDRVPAGTMNQIQYWLKYFPNQVTCGGMIYRALKNEVNMRGKSQFYRILPRGVTLDGFGMDELDVEAMIEATQDFAYSEAGMEDLLQIAFAVVAELLAREKKTKDMYGQRNVTPVQRKREYNGILLFPEAQQRTYDWLLRNGWQLAVRLLKGDNVKEKSEKVENLFIAMEKAYESLDTDEIRRDFRAEARILMTAGVVFSLAGKQEESRRIYHRLVHIQQKRRKSERDDAEEMEEAEALILYGSTWERNGFFARERPKGNDGVEHGALWFYEEAYRRLCHRASEKPKEGRPRVDKLLRFCHFKFGRCFMEMGHLERALKEFDAALGGQRRISHIGSAIDIDANSDAVPCVETAIEASYSLGDLAVDDVHEAANVWQSIGLCHLKLDETSEAEVAFEKALKLFGAKSAMRNMFADLPLDRIYEIVCLGLLCITKGEPIVAIGHYNVALRMFREAMGPKPHLVKSEITNLIALASLKANFRNESYRFYTSNLEVMKQLDDNYVHPLIGTAAANMGVIDIHRLAFAEAHEMLSLAHDQFEQIQGERDQRKSTPQLQQIENNIACLLCLMRDFSAAEKEMRTAIEFCQGVSAPSAAMVETMRANAETIRRKKEADANSKYDEFEYFIIV